MTLSPLQASLDCGHGGGRPLVVADWLSKPWAGRCLVLFVGYLDKCCPESFLSSAGGHVGQGVPGEHGAGDGPEEGQRRAVAQRHEHGEQSVAEERGEQPGRQFGVGEVPAGGGGEDDRDRARGGEDQGHQTVADGGGGEVAGDVGEPWWHVPWVLDGEAGEPSGGSGCGPFFCGRHKFLRNCALCEH